MNIKQFIEFLQTLPQDVIVQVLSHYHGTGYYDQCGWCKVENFHTGGDEWTYGYGEHYELTKDKDGNVFLQLGVMDK